MVTSLGVYPILSFSHHWPLSLTGFRLLSFSTLRTAHTLLYVGGTSVAICYDLLGLGISLP